MNVETTWVYVQLLPALPLYVYDMQVSYEPAARPIVGGRVSVRVRRVDRVRVRGAATRVNDLRARVARERREGRRGEGEGEEGSYHPLVSSCDLDIDQRQMGLRLV